MSGLEIIGGISACISLAKALKSTVEFLLETPEHLAMGKDPWILRLVIAQLKFQRWCEELGASTVVKTMTEDPEHWQDSTEFETFKARLMSILPLNSHIGARLVLSTIRSMDEKFRCARGTLRDDAMPVTSSEADKKNKGFSGIFRRRNETIAIPMSDNADSSEPPDERGTTSKRVRWIVSDRKTLIEQLREIEDFNRELIFMMPANVQNHLERCVQIDTLQREGGSPDKSEHLTESSELRVLANVKTGRSQLMKDDANEPNIEQNNPSARERREIAQARFARNRSIYHLDDIDDSLGDPKRLDPIRAHIILNQRRVLVEWKYYSRNRPAREEKILRLGNLLSMLDSNNLYRKFQTLRYVGLLEDEERSRVGLLFEPTQLESGRKLKNVSLQDVINRSSVACLGERFELAKSLSLAVYQLICVNWLHGSFRSDNIISIQPDEGKPDYRTHEITQLTRLPAFLVMGWDLARRDHASELVESQSMTVNGYQAKKHNIELYSHPDLKNALSRGPPRGFKIEYDIYGLGLVLLEIGLWRTIQSLRQEYVNEEEFRADLTTELVDMLVPRMGTVYWRATQRCLNNDFDLSSNEESEEHNYALKVAFEAQAVSELAKCSA